MREVADFLEAKARADEFVYYGDLAAKFGLPPMSGNFSAHPFHKMFDDFDRQDHAGGRPFRTALVISKEKNMPGDGFFKTLAELRGIDIPKADVGRMTVWITEIGKLRHYYSKKPDGA